MGITGNKIRRLWLPSLILVLAILVISLLASSLISANNARGNSQPPLKVHTPTLTATAVVALTQFGLATSPSVIGAETLQVSPSPDNCTYTMYYWTYYWRSHPEAFSIENITIGDLSYTKAEAIAMLKIKAQDEATALLQEFFTALFNTLNGADSSAIEATLVEAKGWLSLHASGDDLTDSDRQQAQTLIQALMDYNNGVAGPGHCQDEPITPTPIPSPTPTVTKTPTQRPLFTFQPTTVTAVPPDEDQPTKPPSEPTATDKPAPTTPPTEPPTEQPTEPPPPTPAPTDVPTTLDQEVSTPGMLTLSVLTPGVLTPGVFAALVVGQLFKDIRKRFHL